MVVRKLCRYILDNSFCGFLEQAYCQFYSVLGQSVRAYMDCGSFLTLCVVVGDFYIDVVIRVGV